MNGLVKDVVRIARLIIENHAKYQIHGEGKYMRAVRRHILSINSRIGPHNARGYMRYQSQRNAFDEACGIANQIGNPINA